MTALAWAVAFIIMVTVMGASAVGCVFMVERGKTNRQLEIERTSRQNMDQQWTLEQQRLEIMREAQAALPAGEPGPLAAQAARIFSERR